jgi:hypothetical protein
MLEQDRLFTDKFNCNNDVYSMSVIQSEIIESYISLLEA